ncbi:hypothetical protein JCM10207_001234 [Rhodosporidiobolus poonsookiae]
MPDSDPAQPSPECAVCPNKGLLRCTGCRPESTQRFCSRECMKLIWQGHKGICGKDPSAVYFPPLTTVEQAFLRAHKHKPVWALLPKDRMPFLQLELIFRLGQADCDIAEPTRSRLLAFCRSHRSRSLSPLDPAGADPWLFLADDHLQLTDSTLLFITPFPGQKDLAAPSYNPFKELCDVYHQLLILDTLIARNELSVPPRPVPGMKRVMVKLALERFFQTIETSSLTRTHSTVLRTVFEKRLAPLVNAAMATCLE